LGNRGRHVVQALLRHCVDKIRHNDVFHMQQLIARTGRLLLIDIDRCAGV
jgi:hypothetical protein